MRPARPSSRSLRRMASSRSAACTSNRNIVPRTVWRPSPLAGCRFFSLAADTPSPEPSPSPLSSSPSSPPSGPRAVLDLRHIREHVDLYAANCTRRNYGALAGHPARIAALFSEWQASQRSGRALREEANRVHRQMARVASEKQDHDGDHDHDHDHGDAAALRTHARKIKQQRAGIEADETRLTAEMQRLAAALPNLTSSETPDTSPLLLNYIHCTADGQPTSPLNTTVTPRSHVDIGRALGLLDFGAAATAAGWGWYYLLGDAARLEQALVQFALAAAHRAGWQLVAPPSMVRSSIAHACGFQPRDHGGEQQTYTVESSGSGSPMALTATAEIPLAALYAQRTLEAGDYTALPRHAAVSRCYRAEAGARGAATKGLYRVHEFTKVELFAWTAPNMEVATEAFDALVDLQTDLLEDLGLPCRVLEMPATDLGASAFRKIDIEAFFPGRAAAAAESGKASDPDAGWGEVTSASICTDYQSRRLATRARFGGPGASLTFPWTLNGTGLAVPRVLAALLENGWDEKTGTVAIPACLRPWMDGQEVLQQKND